MPIYKLDSAQLGDLEGQGYAFSRKTVWGKAYKGVFFGEDEKLENIQDEDEVTFKGKVYLRSRVSELDKPVTITNLTQTRNGLRADFEAVGNPDQY